MRTTGVAEGMQQQSVRMKAMAKWAVRLKGWSVYEVRVAEVSGVTADEGPLCRAVEDEEGAVSRRDRGFCCWSVWWKHSTEKTTPVMR